MIRWKSINDSLTIFLLTKFSFKRRMLNFFLSDGISMSNFSLNRILTSSSPISFFSWKCNFFSATIKLVNWKLILIYFTCNKSPGIWDIYSHHTLPYFTSLFLSYLWSNLSRWEQFNLRFEVLSSSTYCIKRVLCYDHLTK